MSIAKSVFGTARCGKEVEKYVLKNACGTEVHVLTFGLRIQQLLVKDRNGNLGDVVLGYDTLEPYYDDYQGTFVGRYANRIGKAEFTLDGVTYKLAKNDGDNTLHGGPMGYHIVVWDVAEVNDGDEPSIVFTHTSPDGDENYPGKLDMKVTYSLSADNELKFTYEAVTDKKTPFNPTNHSFFNLTGDHSKKVLDAKLTLNASQYTTVSDDLIPDGQILPVSGTALDFTKGKKLGDDMFADDHLIQLCGGFDHNFCVDGEGFRKHAEVYDEESGRVMEVYSDMPGVQLYTFNKAPGGIGKKGIKMGDHTALCLETQFYPDSVNHDNFPFEYVVPGTAFKSETVYKFSTK